jgi:hypothetical protein
MFADPMRAQSAIDPLTGNAYDLIIEDESYRQRLKARASLTAADTYLVHRCSTPRGANWTTCGALTQTDSVIADRGNDFESLDAGGRADETAEKKRLQNSES